MFQCADYSWFATRALWCRKKSKKTTHIKSRTFITDIFTCPYKKIFWWVETVNKVVSIPIAYQLTYIWTLLIDKKNKMLKIVYTLNIFISTQICMDSDLENNYLLNAPLLAIEKNVLLNVPRLT